MSNDVVVKPSDSHQQLVTKSLPKALNVLNETMELDSWEDGEDGKRKFNTRINGQKLRAALGVISVVERLGDQALRRQAGGQLKKLIDAIKAEKKRSGD